MSDAENDPVPLIEDADTGDRFLVYGSRDGMHLDIQYEGENLWMTQAQIALLFGRDRSVVSKHIAGVFSDGELGEEGNVQKVHIAHSTKPVSTYSLDLVISVGYRVSSKSATAFRKWATQTLVRFATKGFVVDSVRLKDPKNADRLRELRDIIREIRSDEANVYRELQRICAMCSDYDPGSKDAVDFYKKTQAKLIYAVVSNTPAEVVMSRADHLQENMGLQTWPNENIRKSDVTVSKNYLAEPEIRELNRLTTILLDIFEDQADIGRLVVIADAGNLLDTQLKNLNRAVLDHGGKVKKAVADARAHGEFTKFSEHRKLQRHREADQLIAELAKEARNRRKS